MQYFQEGLPVSRQFALADAGDGGQRSQVAGPPLQHFHEGGVVENDVRRHALRQGQLAAMLAQGFPKIGILECDFRALVALFGCRAFMLAQRQFFLAAQERTTARAEAQATVTLGIDFHQSTQ